jgi:GTP diphosphokinase / guanosine-3',5'-bis(diphosphate) 3'-diphosphatase
MIDADDLLSLVRNYNPKTNEALLRGAYAYAQRMHEGQKRHSGEPYFTHPVAVAAILTEQRLDDATIATALLHDTIEDTKGTYTEIETLFGHDVAELVDGVTKLTNLQAFQPRIETGREFPQAPDGHVQGSARDLW